MKESEINKKVKEKKNIKIIWERYKK